MTTPTPQQNLDAILEVTPIAEDDKQRIRERTERGEPLTPAEAQLTPGGAQIREAQLRVINEPPAPPAPADTAEVGVGTGEVTLTGTSEVQVEGTEEVGLR